MFEQITAEFSPKVARGITAAVLACGILTQCTGLPIGAPAAAPAPAVMTAPGPMAAVAPGPPLSPDSICRDIAAVRSAPDAAALLASIDPHSAVGVLWAQLGGSCVGPVPVAGVNSTWKAQVWAMFLQAVPVLLPRLIPLIVGL